MTTLLRKGLGAALVAACVTTGGFLPLGAHAQSAPAPQGQAQAGRQQDLARKKEHMAQRETALREKLKLTSAQQGAWNAYLEKMRPAAGDARPERPDLNKLTAPERMEWMLGRMKEHEQRLQQRLTATKELYAQLTPEQRKIFDAETVRGWEQHRGMRQGKHRGKDGTGE